MSVILAIAPHPDDETLGCGGTLLRHRAEGNDIHWLIVTEMTEEGGFAADRIEAREKEITAVAEAYGFSSVTRLGFQAAHLDTLAMGDLIADMGKTFGKIKPETVYVPFPGDVHTDHWEAFDAAAACCKWFRYPSVRRVIACEIPSESDFGLDPTVQSFRPNLFVDISDWLDEKIRVMETYAGEMEDFPFPRSEQAIRALAAHRGSQAGCEGAEAFMVLKEIR